ncbi:tetratricopeptide repeat protein [Streptomyces sp. NPDC047082]|uniref:tetratricopeptide repeat protein n=1 Tax=Streptomyces sp. NPDC047082 TaxID=3155259 RepID=UPI00340769D5
MGYADPPPGEDGGGDQVNNTISGGNISGVVFQARDVTLQLPPKITPALSGLPTPTVGFTGRDKDLKQLLADLAPGPGGCPTVLVSAVAGLAGIGKTELAVQAAARALAEPGWFPGGVLFVEMAGYHEDPHRRVTPERALEGLLRALSIPGEHIPNGLEDRQRLYRSVLATYAKEQRRILVVVDNVSSAAHARPLLPTDGATAALVTSRHTLDGLNARLHDLVKLDSRDKDEHARPAGGSDPSCQWPASRGLLDAALRAARGDADTRITDDPQAAETIAALCDGLPLALRIGAAILAAAPHRPAASLADDLRDEHTRLDELQRIDGASRKPSDRAVRASFNLSYQLLDDDHARLFRLLPLNPGPDVSTEAAAHLAGTTEKATRKLLQHLSDAHLVEQGQIWGRWRMHDLVRLYADEHGRTHSNPDQREVARTRLFTHYQDTTTAAADTHLDTRPSPRAPRFNNRNHALEWLDAEHANLTATVMTAAALGHPRTAIALAFSLVRYLVYRRSFDDAITLNTTALALCRELRDRRGEAEALTNIGIALREVRRFEEAIDAHTGAGDLFRRLGDQHREAVALTNCGTALLEVRRFEEAIDALTRAAATHRELRNPHGEGQALNNLGIALREVRRFEKAIDAQTRAADLFRRLGDRHSEAVALNNLGAALLQVRRIEEAIDALTRAAATYRELRDQHGEAQALTNLGAALLQVRRIEEAIDAHTRAADLFRRLGDRHREATARNNLGNALREMGRFEKAIDAHAWAAATYREFRDRHREAKALDSLGNALHEVGRFEEAIDAHTWATATYRELCDWHGQAVALNNLGNALGEMGRFEEAIDALTGAVDLLRELCDRHGQAVALNNLGNALHEVGRFEEAIDAHTRAADLREVDE